MPDNTNPTQDSSLTYGKNQSPPIQDSSPQYNEPSTTFVSPAQENLTHPPTSPEKKFSKEDLNSILTTQSLPKKRINLSVIATILGIIFLVASVVSGVWLVQKQQRFSQKASEDQKTQPTQTYASCNDIKVYNKNWELLSPEQLKLLETEDTIFLTIKCSVTSGNFDMARFTINGQTKESVTTKKQGTNEFYYEYRIPKEVNTFKIKAEIHHSELGWF